MSKYHFIGMGGIGMSALAHILIDKQAEVSGSDLSENTNVKNLIKKGADFSLGHREKNVTQEKIVVYSSGIAKDNPEFQAALALNCPLLHRSELLNTLMEGFTPLAVTGTHGKTTTSSLLTAVLKEAGEDPSFAIGGLFAGENGRLGQGKYFVAEADESDGTFLRYHPFGAIVTNVEEEHMEHFKTKVGLHKAFGTFFSQVGSEDHLFYCGDDANLVQIAEGRGVAYGFGPQCVLRILSCRHQGWRSFFDFSFEGKVYAQVELALLGEMNVLNAAAVFGLCLRLGIEEEKIRAGLAQFSGVKRRLEKKGEVHNILFLDDYAHHPTEVRKTLEALREAVLERRVILLFQPHRYSRVHHLWEEFGGCFEFADHLFVTEVYSAQESDSKGVTSEKLVEHIREKGTVAAEFLSRKDYVEHLSQFLRPHDVLVTMGAGDITTFSAELMERLKQLPAKKYTLGLIFGGCSPEHEISLRSARFVNESLDRAVFEVKFFGIDKEGKWIAGPEAERCLLEKTAVESPSAEPLLSSSIAGQLASCEVFFPVLHGPNGEDGTIQGFFEMLQKPYAGPDFRACAISMDKILTKKLLLQAGVPTSDFVMMSYYEWLKNKERLLKELHQLALPLYVKPSRCGSSFGITKVTDYDQLEEAVSFAFRYDATIFVEEGVVDARELEFAVVGSSHIRVDVPAPGEKCAGGVFVDYELKYSQKPVQTTVTPEISTDLLVKGKFLVKKAYEALGITGMTRVDCLLDPDGKYNFFEVNAIPGLTRLSLFPKIWAREGVSGQELITRLILAGFMRNRAQKRHHRAF